jgi:hypothetical protein
MVYWRCPNAKAPAVLQHPGARPIRSNLMDETSVPWGLSLEKHGRLLFALYSPPHVYADGTNDRQPVLTALFQEPTDNGGVGYTIREFSLSKGEMFYRFPKSCAHWSRAVIRQEWYRETETRLPDSAFEISE